MAPLKFEAVITNLKAIRALGFAARVLGDAQESAPWNTELKTAEKALRYAIRRLDLRVRRGRQR